MKTPLTSADSILSSTNRLVLRIAPILLFCGLSHAYSGGPPSRYSGAPGDNPGSCTSCHGGTALNAGPGSVKIVLPNGNTYTPGVTQHIIVQVSDPQQRRWGFQLSARLKSDPAHAQAGDLRPTDGFTQVICDGERPAPCASNAVIEFIEHTVAGTRMGTSGGVAFEFDWTPPASQAGTVVLYAAGNAANGDGNLTGDRIYTSSIEIAPTAPPSVPSTAYALHNLVSDVSGLADHTDPNLLNPWALALNATGGFWVANNHSGTATVYNGAGESVPSGNPAIVKIAGASGNASPTGEVFNGGPGFEIAPGAPALFIFAAENGTISGWNPTFDPSNTKLMADRSGSGANYKGLALGSNASGPLLYAANFAGGTIDVFDATYQPTTVSGGFADPNLPSGFAPFNIQRIGRRLYVAYALQDGAKQDAAAGDGKGCIDVFDMDGNLVQRLVSNGPLNAPWGLSLAPDFFGDFSNALLVGNFGDGAINAFDPFTGAFLGTLQDSSGNAIRIPGLWALRFGNGHSAGDANTLYFTAGIANGGSLEDHGLLGSIQVAQ